MLPVNVDYYIYWWTAQTKFVNLTIVSNCDIFNTFFRYQHTRLSSVLSVSAQKIYMT